MASIRVIWVPLIALRFIVSAEKKIRLVYLLSNALYEWHSSLDYLFFSQFERMFLSYTTLMHLTFWLVFVWCFVFLSNLIPTLLHSDLILHFTLFSSLIAFYTCIKKLHKKKRKCWDVENNHIPLVDTILM